MKCEKPFVPSQSTIKFCNMTVAEAIKILKKLPPTAKLVTADHDHNEWEWNSFVDNIYLRKQIDQPWEFMDTSFWLKEDVVVIRP